MMQHEIHVELGERSYPIYIGADILSQFAPTCRKHGIGDSVIILTDTNVAKRHLAPLVKNLLHCEFQPLPIIIPAGEQQKNLKRANAIYTTLLKKKISRSATIIALGGGVIGDLAGFVAATYQRGVKFIQVPTTLLAQVDSSIGGKVGVNHSLGKNMIGAFQQPQFVWMDAEYLATLPKREIVCGFGEVVKYGIIRDVEFFSYLESHLDDVMKLQTEALLHVQTRCAEIKADVVSRDERESGLRMILNCGHTIGHGLESAGHYRLLKHGEAILFGLLTETELACKLGIVSADVVERIAALIHRVPMKVKLSSLKMSEIFDAMGRDKKRDGKKLRFVLPTTIGTTTVVDSIETKVIRSAIAKLLQRY
jgi:3-dehydroquinate synthase